MSSIIDRLWSLVDSCRPEVGRQRVTGVPPTDPVSYYQGMTAVDVPRFVRADGPDKVTGSGRYAADLQLPGMLHAKFLYAGHTHARITRLNTGPARTIPGVLAVLTAADVPDVRYSPGVADRRLFATDVVRYESEIVAAVAATSAEAAEAAVAAIEVDYEPLAPVTELEAALADGSPLVHPDLDSYDIDEGIVAHGNTAAFSSIELGDAPATMATAATVVSSRYVADGSHAAPIEPRAVVAQWEGEKLTVWSSTQVPFDARAGICQTLQLPSNRVRVIVPHLGGGFGGKCGFHFEAHIAALARAARRPVKLIFSRREEFMVPDRRREGMIVDVTTGLDDHGRIVARTGWIAIDNGAYIADCAFFPQLAAMHVAGPYQVPNLRVEAHLVYTNHQPSGSVRAPTAPQACWALESHTDELAATIGMDPVEFRRLNGIDNDTVGPSGQHYERTGLQECITAATELVGYGRDLPEDEAIGVAIGWWPSFSMPAGAYVKIDDDGAGQIITGAQECGTGAVMTLRQLAADELGMDPEDFQLVYQDTSAGPYDTGATGSQTLFNNGRAVVGAARQVAEQLKALAAEQLEAAPDDIVLADGAASVVGSPGASVSIAELAATAAGGELLLGHGSGSPAQAPEVGATCVGDQGMAAWVSPQVSCHAVHIRLDPDTGVVRVLKVGAAHDSGRIINPMGALGQVHGGVMMGVGQALTEITVYDHDGHQLNPMLLEYKLQTAADGPEIEVRFIESAPGDGPGGAKGLAEAPNVATAAAIANGLARLIGHPIRHLPMTAERVWTELTAGTESIDRSDGEQA
jgi:CO/xanthine dehydrogenase Mo-binding subunit